MKAAILAALVLLGAAACNAVDAQRAAVPPVVEVHKDPY
jgi:hypothetical protein